jgi:CRP-like cAMP-binding protein
VRFLHGTDIFNALPEQATANLLACMAPMTIQAGERFIRQGEDGYTLYLIQEGSCTVTVEKDSVEKPVARQTS